MPQRPIGIFDSGIGGLTVFKEIDRLLPNEDLVYLGDTARVPYGTKSAETVRRYAAQIVHFLLKKNVKMVVVACNTASAYAVKALRDEFSIPIVGVIEPGVTGALRTVGSFEPAKPDSHSRPLRIAVIGTEGTIASGAYAEEFQRQKPGLSIVGASCPLFVPLVEEGWLEGEVTEQIANFYLKDLLARNVNTLILGCTHYPMLKKTIKKVAGPGVSLIDSAEETARTVSDTLLETGLKRERNPARRLQFFVTDSPERFRKLGQLFLNQPLEDVHHVEI